MTAVKQGSVTVPRLRLMSPANAEQRPAIELEIEAQRPYLLCLARMQVGAPDAAEDIVQDRGCRNFERNVKALHESMRRYVR